MSPRRQRLVLGGMLLALLLAGVDSTIVGTVLAADVEAVGGARVYAMTFAAYILAAAVTVPAWGPASDRWGRRRTFLAGLGAFVAGSILAGLAPTSAVLLAGRAVQGVGAGAIFSVPLSIAGVIFPPEKRAQVFGILSSAWGVASVAGPLAGAIIVAQASWRWAFLVNVPLGAVAWVLVRAWMPESYGDRSGRFDSVGSILAGGAAALLVSGFTLVDGGAARAGLAAGGVLLAAAFVRHESRADSPLLPLEFFRSRDFSAGITAAVAVSVAAYGIFAFLPYEAGRVLPEPAAVAWALGAFTVTWSVAAVVAGRLVQRLGARPVAVAGVAAFAAGAMLLPRALQAGLAEAMATAALAGLGVGATLPGLVATIQNAVDTPRMGSAMGGFQFLSQVASAIGIGVFGLAYRAAGFGASVLLAVLVLAVAFLASLLIRGARGAGAEDAPATAA